MSAEYAEEAKMFCDAIRGFAGKSENLDNLESYLGNCFGVWMKYFASTPLDLASEMKSFAGMEI